MLLLAQTDPPPIVRFHYPLPNRAMVTSGYGPRWGRMHWGIDLAAPTGTPIYAAHSGTVLFAGWGQGGYGLMVDIGNETHQTRYSHLSKVLVKQGQSVEAGTTIGLVGSTGFSTGPHLHFEERRLVDGVWRVFNPARSLGH